MSPHSRLARLASALVLGALALLAPADARAWDYEGLTAGDEEEEPPRPAPKPAPKKAPEKKPVEKKALPKPADKRAPRREEPAEDEEDEKEKGPFTLDATLSLTSTYIWRGYDFSHGAVSLQPYVEFELPLAFVSEASGILFTAFTSTALDSRPEVDDTQWGVLYHHTFSELWELQAGYLLYLGPGTESMPNEGPDPEAADWGGEFMLVLSSNLDPLYTSISYATGHRGYEGNSLNVFSEMWVDTPLEGFTFGPYLQLDYTDQFGVAEQTDYPGFSQRFTAVEGGAQFEYEVGDFRLRAAASLIAIPSQYVRVTNRDAGASEAMVRPWWAFGLAYVQE